jgi:small-conductance mechanosensitive channel
VADFCITSGDISRAALKTFRERGITVSFPQREVRLLDAA